ncbi:glycosyltransferase family 2 protein [Ampullimonas aquatilis]|uniref:glycosyltransferase family 2 protein n=1 Tax=Ampullimonas aquatilis TaxID=1341549 RepID=UPI003C73AC2F
MLTLVIPVYKNEASIPALLDVISKLNYELDGAFEAVFVIDGSPDHCYELLRTKLPRCIFRSQLVLLSRNFGSFAAIRAGLGIGRGDYFAVMAADLQEPPEMVLEMYGILHKSETDVVVGVREVRNDPPITRFLAQIFWGLYRRYVMPEIPPGGVDIFGCNRHFRDTLLTLDERHSSLIAQIFWLGFRRKCVTYNRQERQHGRSAWTLSKKINYLMDSLFAFTDLPIRLLIRGGGCTALFAGLLGIFVGLARLFGRIEVPGYAMIINVVVFLGAVNLFGLGIVGSYAWRAYENTKSRPIAIPIKVEIFPA